MTHLFDNPKEFAASSLKGMVAAYSEYLQHVHGGVVRTSSSPAGEVAIVVGGGSGHYPAFAGWVGPGMAHGSVCGNVFASPSTSQAISVVKNADNGAGAILLFGNYAGDCLHFGNAADELNERGIRTEVVTISDDIASNTPDKHEDRRGIAGDLFVVKVAGAAAAEGRSLDDVVAVTRKANHRTRSLGVAFSGCTLPGAHEPLFTVDEGQYALGLGIHGEPGLSTHPLNGALEIAELLVTRVLEEEPERSSDYAGRIAVLVNGLGASKYEELFVLYGHVADLLEARGLEIVAPVVDEQVTSLDMAGVSLSIMYLDEELETLWRAPADTPAFRTGSIEASGEKRVLTSANPEQREIVEGSPESRAQAEQILAALQAMAQAAIDAEESLGKLDSIAGDGDHGQGMTLGATAALRGATEAFGAGAGARTLLLVAGDAWAEGAGGTSGGYWGAALRAVGERLADDAAADSVELGRAIGAGIDSFAAPGGAVVGDKTMVDATVPFATALGAQLDAGAGLMAAWTAALEAGDAGAEGTANLVAKRGRARTHGEKTLGHPDPGAISFIILMRAALDTAQN